jgi:probable F420-dependent oxidoreductase
MASPRPPIGFGFGIFPYTRLRDVREALEIVQLGDELGLEAVGLPEHLLPPCWPQAERSTKYWYDLTALAAFLAAGTKRVKLLTSVLVVPYHPPIQAAKALATLDVLSGGRLLLGIGAGWMKAEFRRLGIPFEERGAITDEYLRAMRELWTSDSPAFHGTYVSFEDVSFFPKPVQQPSIPILVGGSGPRPLRRVAEIGDGWFPMTATLDDLRSGIAEIRRQMQALGRDPSRLWVGYTGFGFGSDPETARMRAHVGDTTEKRSPRTPEETIAAIEAYRDAGVTFLSVGFPWQNAAELMARMRRFAREVMPAFA